MSAAKKKNLSTDCCPLKSKWNFARIENLSPRFRPQVRQCEGRGGTEMNPFLAVAAKYLVRGVGD